MTKRIYLAGPLGFSELGRVALASLKEELVGPGVELLDPFALAPQDEIDRIAHLSSLDAQGEAWGPINRRIGQANCAAIDSCDIVLAILDGPDVDSGTAAEIGCALARGKKIVGHRGDFRLAGDNVGSTVNLQVEYFICASGGEIVDSIAAARAALARM